MRRRVGLALVAVLGVWGCGGSAKPPKEPAAEAPPPDDGTKWDSSSETAETARHSKELAASGASNSGSSPGASEPTTPSAPPKQRRSDEYDKEATEVVLKRAGRQVKANCGAATDEDGKASGPWGTGSMHLVLGHNGHIKEGTIGAPFADKPTGRCANQAFKGLQYPPWAGSDMTLEYPVEIVPPHAAKK